MIPGDLLSAFPHRQFNTLPGLLDSWAALPNSNPNACMPMQGGSLYHFYDGLWYDPAERRTHDLPCERQLNALLKSVRTAPTEPLPDDVYNCNGIQIRGRSVVVQMLRGRIVQINDKSMKIATQGNFGTLISNRSWPILDFAQEGCIRNPKWPTLKMWIFHIILNKVDTNAFWKYSMKYW